MITEGMSVMLWLYKACGLGHCSAPATVALLMMLLKNWDFSAGPSTSMDMLKSYELSWQDQLQVRGWCRLRAGVTCLRHWDGKESQERSQDCIFCGVRGVRNP